MAKSEKKIIATKKPAVFAGFEDKIICGDSFFHNARLRKRGREPGFPRVLNTSGLDLARANLRAFAFRASTVSPILRALSEFFYPLLKTPFAIQ